MSILDKAIGLAGAAVGGIVAATALIGKEKKLETLDLEFSQVTSSYEKKKIKLCEKIANGNYGAQKKLSELEREYNEEKREYEIKRQRLLPKKSKTEQEIDKKALEHTMEMEKLEARHHMEMEKLEIQSTRSVSAPLSPISEGTVVCTNCGNSILPEMKFCCHCGKEITFRKFCAKCGAKLNLGSKFCSACGEKST